MPFRAKWPVGLTLDRDLRGAVAGAVDGIKSGRYFARIFCTT